jgi:hypothetical protein
MDIKLNFINNSNDKSNSDVVIFQKNQNTDFDEKAVAWKVIQNCGSNSRHPFIYPMTMQIAAGDSYGNETLPVGAQNGQLFHMIRNDTGNVVEVAGQSTNPTEVQFKNDLATGAVSGKIYKDGRLLAIKNTIVPQQKAVFQFLPKLFIGTISEIHEGDEMNSAVVADVNTELDLVGILSADIVMEGGGPGASSTAFTFKLENVVRSN